jgi:CO dehydrogenase maturation factor
MKIAAVGKGGSGKTTVVGTLTRILAEDGIKVLAIDGDPNPNLALTLGISRNQAEQIESIPASIMAVKEELDGTRRLAMTVSEDELIHLYGAAAPNDIDLIVMGKPPDGSAGSGCMCASHRAVRGLISEMTNYREHTITDMEAGLEHLKRGTVRNVDTMLIIAEPYYRSLEAAGRTWSLANELAIPHVYVVANKVRNAADQAAIEEFCAQRDMPIIGSVPNEEQFMEAERQAQAPIDFAPGCAGTAAIREIARKLRDLEAPGVMT